MVIVAELVKLLLVAQRIVGSSPIFHTKTGIFLRYKGCNDINPWSLTGPPTCAYSLNGKTLNYGLRDIVGSNPRWRTNINC